MERAVREKRKVGMRISDFKLIMGYLHRFIEGPVFSRQKAAVLMRYAAEACLLVWEKANGLDYSMVYWTKDENMHHSVYTKSPKNVLERVFHDLSEIEEKSFLDVGCGKGYVITAAGKYPFKKQGGVEYNKELYKICCRNLKKKRMSTKYVFCGDAKKFKHYNEFDVFFFNNPFDETILEPVAEKIYDSHVGRKCWIYFLNPKLKARTDAIEKAGFRLVKQIADPNEWYFNINVYMN